jgi:hypothetical protein
VTKAISEFVNCDSYSFIPPLTAYTQGECTKDGGQTVKLRGDISFDEITMDDRDDLQVFDESSLLIKKIV